jgi:hypothetical protein
MLTKADDFPIHQLPEPIGITGTDRNFYDRFYFNAYDPDGETYIAAAMGLYPALDIIDAAFCIVRDGVQHNLRASRHMNSERLDLKVGPISIEIVEPLQKLRLKVDSPDHGIRADMLFDGRAAPIEEPRFIIRNGPRTFMDYTRLTQCGRWEGWLDFQGSRMELKPGTHVGTRDRSWGVRPVGAPDSQPTPGAARQFCFYWAPLNFDDCVTYWHTKDLSDGFPHPRARSGVIQMTDGSAPCAFEQTTYSTVLMSGSRHAKFARIDMQDANGQCHGIEIERQFEFFMPGLGYGHPEWGHGRDRGIMDVGFDSYEIDKINRKDPAFAHVQAFSHTTLTTADGKVRKGRGILEQVVFGPHAPSGLTGLFDVAP